MTDDLFKIIAFLQSNIWFFMCYKKLIIAIISFNLLTINWVLASSNKEARNTQVKEVEVRLSNSQFIYPMNIRYRVFSGKKCYAAGAIKGLSADLAQYIYINQIPSNLPVTIDIYKMNVGNRTVFNDPCKLTLTPNQLRANISVGFHGDIATHGSFTCMVSTLQFICFKSLSLDTEKNHR